MHQIVRFFDRNGTAAVYNHGVFSFLRSDLYPPALSEVMDILYRHYVVSVDASPTVMHYYININLVEELNEALSDL